MSRTAEILTGLVVGVLSMGAAMGLPRGLTGLLLAAAASTVAINVAREIEGGEE